MATSQIHREIEKTEKERAKDKKDDEAKLNALMTELSLTPTDNPAPLAAKLTKYITKKKQHLTFNILKTPV